MTTFKRYTGTAWETIGLPFVNSGPAAVLGYAEVIANQTGITTSDVDITGLSVTVTVPEGRRLLISGKIDVATTAGTGAQTELKIKEGATQLQRGKIEAPPATSESVEVNVIISPTAGTHTYKLALVTGNGTVTMVATTQLPAYIVVEDITGSTLPYSPASVPVGQLGYAQVLANQTGISAEVAVTGLSVNVVVPAGRQIRISSQVQVQSATTSGTVLARLKEGGTTLQTTQENYNTIGGNGKYVAGSVVLSPTAGAHTYFLTLQGTAGTIDMTASAGVPAYLLVEDVTPTPSVGTGAPSSTLAFSESTSPVTTSGTTELTLFTLNVAVPAGRRLKVTHYEANNTGTTAGDRYAVTIKEDGVVKNTKQWRIATNDPAGLDSWSAIVSPAAGAHVYTVSIQRAGGSGTATFNRDGNNVGYFLVEDITGALWPDSAQVTSGLIASEGFILYVPNLTATTTNPTLGSSPQQTGAYIKYGRLVVGWARIQFGTGSTAGSGGYRVSLPVTAKGYAGQAPMGGSAIFYDTSTNTIFSDGVVQMNGADMILWRNGAAASAYNVSNVSPFVWADGDFMSMSFMYEAVS